ncbi:MAG: CBS domain-containing protein [Candidatus Sedimenticola sp. PURPLELP]
MSERQIVRVRDIMKTSFDTVDGMDTVESALNKMAHIETKCLVVGKRNKHDEHGMVMISDIARKVLARDRPTDRVNIYEIMSKPVITVDPDMDIRYAARLFTVHDLSRAPVVQDREIIGIVSLTDMVTKGLRRQ